MSRYEQLSRDGDPGRARPELTPLTRRQFEGSRSLRGSDFVGSPDEVTEKILFQHELFGHDRFMIQLGVGTLPHEKMLRAIELLGTEVAPVVRREIAKRKGRLAVL